MQCPRCEQVELNEVEVLNALSRRTRSADADSVYVCSPCGTHKAFQDAFDNGATPISEWPVPWRNAGNMVARIVESMYEE